MNYKCIVTKICLTVSLIAAGLYLSSCGGEAVTVKPSGKRIPDGIYANARPTLFNDSQQVLFAGTYNGKTAIYSMDTSGKSLKKILENKYDVASPAINKDETRIAFTIDYSGDGRGAIAICNIDGRGMRVLTKNQPDSNTYDRLPTFTPDGTAIIFQRSEKHAFIQEFWKINLNTMQEEKLMEDFAWHPTEAVITPDGKSMLFGQMIKMTFEGDKKIFPFRIYKYTFANKKLETLGLLGRNNPCISPDGKDLAYTGTDDAALFVADQRGNNPRRLFYAEYKCKSPLYSKDGRNIIFLHFKEKWSARASIGLLHVVTSSYSEIIPQWESK